MRNKKTIRIYKNDVFPRKLITAYDLDAANEHFIGADDKPLEKIEGSVATTYRVNAKRWNFGGLLVYIKEPKEFDTGTISHESLHVVKEMLEDLPCMLNDETEEVWCYMVGWVAKCIESYMKDKIWGSYVEV